MNMTKNNYGKYKSVDVLKKTVNGKRVVSKKAQKDMEAALKKFNGKDVYTFLLAHPKLNKKLLQQKAIMCELEKQVHAGKTFQTGFLYEATMLYAIANAFGLIKCVKKVPAILKKKYGKAFFRKARYVYYNPDDLGTLVIQYGSPDMHDFTIIIDGEDILGEIKNMPALIESHDLLYDENGHLKGNVDGYLLEKIKEFNLKTNVFDSMGHNYKINPTLNDVGDIFEKSGMDVFATTKNARIIVMTPDEMKQNVTFDGSEIRTSGKNAIKPFTQKRLNDVLCSVGTVRDGVCYISNKDNVIGFVKGRGRGERYKIDQAFFVKEEKVTIKNGIASFRVDSVKQVKPSIDIHVKLRAS